MNFLLPNIELTKMTFTDEQLKPIRAEINNIKSSEVRLADARASQIKYTFSLDHIKEYADIILQPFLNKFIESNNWNRYISQRYNCQETNFNLKVDRFWVNMQKKHEYNPIHIHNGLIAFVIWLDIPYLIEDEWNFNNKLDYEINQAANFNFHYTDILGKLKIESIPVDIRYQNTGIIFPTELSHSVNPFYSSDEYRISVAGNIEVYE